MKPAFVAAIGIVALGISALMITALSAPSSKKMIESRWEPMEAPRADLECWQTHVSGNKYGQQHIECWPKKTH